MLNSNDDTSWLPWIQCRNGIRVNLWWKHGNTQTFADRLNCCRSKCHGENVKSGEKTTWNIMYQPIDLAKRGGGSSEGPIGRREGGLGPCEMKKKNFERKPLLIFVHNFFFIRFYESPYTQEIECFRPGQHSHLFVGRHTCTGLEMKWLKGIWSDKRTQIHWSKKLTHVACSWMEWLGERVMRSNREKSRKWFKKSPSKKRTASGSRGEGEEE